MFLLGVFPHCIFKMKYLSFWLSPAPLTAVLHSFPLLLGSSLEDTTDRNDNFVDNHFSGFWIKIESILCLLSNCSNKKKIISTAETSISLYSATHDNHIIIHETWHECFVKLAQSCHITVP